MTNYNNISVIEEASDGDLLCGGLSDFHFTLQFGKTWVGKLKSDGSAFQWINFFIPLEPSGTGNLLGNVNDIVELSNGNIIATGVANETSNGFPRYGFMISFDANGNYLWHRRYVNTATGEYVESIGSVTEITPNEIMVTAIRDGRTSGFEYFVLMKINSADGSVSEVKYYPRAISVTHHDILKTTDNGLLVGIDIDTRLGLIKTDINGEGENICVIDYCPIKAEDFSYQDEPTKLLPNTYLQLPTSSYTYTLSSSIDPQDACCSYDLNLGVSDILCNDNGTFTLSTDPAQEYYWSTCETTPTITVSQPGTYTVSVVDANGCVGYGTLTFTNPVITGINITGPDNKCCTQDNYTVPSGYANYIWFLENPGDGTITQIGPNEISVSWNDPTTDSYIGLEIFNDLGCSTGKIIFPVKGCCPLLIEPAQIAFETDYCDPTLLSDLITQYGLVSPYTTNEYISINNDLIIDTNFEFNNCPNIKVENGRKIMVNPGITFRLDRTEITNKCNYMWDGIYVEDPTSTVEVVNNSLLEQAINAIVSNNGGVFTVSGSLFNNDVTGIKVNNYTGSHTGTVVNSRFTSVTGALLPPFNAVDSRMQYGVKLTGVNLITIGNDLSGFNRFSNTLYGIYSDRSSANIYNNRFFGLLNVIPTCTNCQCPPGTGICAFSTKTNPQTINIGGAGNKRNNFNFTTHGISIHDFIDLNADNNVFNFMNTGIRYENGNNRTVNIINNSIQNFVIGINCYNNVNAVLTIDNNDLNTGSGFLNSISNTGIVVQNPFQAALTANVTNNVIKRIRTGVYFLNCVSTQSWPSNTINATGNEVHFAVVLNNTSINHIGIRIDGCTNAKADYNIVDKLNATNPNNAVTNFLWGINVVNSTLTTVVKNNITKMGVGIRTFGDCTNATLACNTLDANYYGFNFVGPSKIDDQLPFSIPTDNVWTGTINSDLAGNIFPAVEWNYNGTPPSSGALTPLSLIGSAPQPTTFLGICNQYLAPPVITQREINVGPIARDELSYFNYDPEFKWKNKKHAFRQLKQNPGWLSLGQPDDTTFQNFYNYTETSPVGGFDKVNDLILLEDFQQASIENSGISTNCLMEFNQKRVNEIYISYRNTDTISSSDSTELESFAWQNSLIGGDAVFTARVLLQLDIIDDENGSTRFALAEFETEEVQDIETVFDIYPNPASSELFLYSKSNDNSNSHLKFTVTDLLGNIILQSIITKSITLIKIDGISNGIYFINLYKEDELNESKKFIISNEK